MTTALLLKVKVMEWPSMSPDLNPIELHHPQAEGGEAPCV